MSQQFKLMREKRFLPFFCTQFLGALNDNVFKTTLITMAVFHTDDLTTLNGAALATLLPGIFILPFFLFSATAGQIADKFEKSRLIRFVKIFEVLLMLFAALGFVLHIFWLLVLALFMMGMHSALFGPVKYAYLPQHLTESELVGGNGMVEMGTFVAILFGQIIGAGLGMHQGGELVTALSVVGLALLGYFASKQIPNSPAAEPSLKINWNPITETGRNIAFVWKSQAVWLAIIGISWFWFYGATLLAQFPVFAKEVLHGDESVFILLLAVFSVGVGVGSLLCEKLSKGIVEIGLVPLGAIGMMAFGVDLYLASAGGITNWRLLADIALIGLFGGVYIVPLYTLIQSRAQKTHQSRVIAANNILNALFMGVSGVFAMLIFKLGFNIPQLFLITALMNALVIIYLCLRQPEYFSRMKNWRL
ncbi:MAG: MFS transporter [Candidatus Methylopumilus sp.]|nr:MFS transporter [Candidatus Methylopumilus sp.]